MSPRRPYFARELHVHAVTRPAIGLEGLCGDLAAGSRQPASLAFGLR